MYVSTLFKEGNNAKQQTDKTCGPHYKKLTITIENIHKIIRTISVKNTTAKSTIKSCE